jgi:hypothetical protein
MSKMKTLAAPIPDEFIPVIAQLCQELNASEAELVRLAVREFADRRGYSLPEVKLKHGGYRIENAVTANGWINEYHIMKVIYGMDDYTISVIDHTNPDSLDDYPLLKSAAIHNNKEFARQFPRDEDLEDSNPAYLIQQEETGRNKIRALYVEYHVS